MDAKLVTIFGASGFVGSAIVEELAKTGCRIRAAQRVPNQALFLKPLGHMGQVNVSYADVTKPETLDRAVKGANVVINCVGILYEGPGRRKFGKVQAEAPAAIARAAKKAGVKTFIQISSLSAGTKSPSKYARTKAEGEKAVTKVFKDAVIMRPSLIFGAGDNFFNKFAKMAKTPLVPLTLVGPKTRFQPVFVGDIAKAVTKAASEPSKYRGVYELGGPETYSFRVLIDYMLGLIEVKKWIVTLPFFMASLIGFGFDILAKILPITPPITRDQVTLLKTDNVLSGKEKGFKDFGIQPTALEAIVPSYLKFYRPKGLF